jgi:CelD/BcsL family acetyltransferase involved in cellulose biosynthesis
MNLYFTNPLTDPRWDDLVSRHQRASAFHQHGWLEALSRTYGYQPLVLTTAPDGKPMRDGLVFCRVKSWITGTRIVSLPFTDHCEPLIDDYAELAEFLNRLQAERKSQRWRYVEIRPLSQISNGQPGLQPSRAYCYHELDLTPSLEDIFRGLHKDSIRRRIQHAEREGLVYETGCSESFVDQFYGLLLKTRRRHRVLPQPRAWFKNLVDCMGENVQIRLARKGGLPIAAVMTLRHRSCVTYKYGCSDERLHNMGAMPFLFWRLIEESKASGAQKIDLGRSDWDQKSLISFKDKFGSTRKILNYYRYPVRTTPQSVTWGELRLRQFCSILPDSISSAAGRLVYRHIG